MYLQKSLEGDGQSPLTGDQKSPVAVDNKLKLKRLTIDLTPEAHRVLKSRAAKAGVTMRKLVLQILQREGLVTEPNETEPNETAPYDTVPDVMAPSATEPGANAYAPHKETTDD